MFLTDRVFQFIFKRMEKTHPRPKVKRRECVSHILDKPFRTKDGRLMTMDIYMPKLDQAREEKLPAVIAIHGGGFFIGSKDYYDEAGEELASRGYLVCAVEYRHIPEVRVYEEMSDICQAIDDLSDHLCEYNGDPDRVYVIAESAGAFFATYLQALGHSKELQDIFACEPPKLKIRAMALMFGMFYTNSGSSMSTSMYGNDERKVRMRPFADPEHPDIIENYPPTLFITSDADFLKKDSYNYQKALIKQGIENDLINMGNDKKLNHAFTVMHPDYEESRMALDHADKWFAVH